MIFRRNYKKRNCSPLPFHDHISLSIDNIFSILFEHSTLVCSEFSCGKDRIHILVDFLYFFNIQINSAKKKIFSRNGEHNEIKN